MAKLTAKDRVIYVKKLANAQYQGKDAQIWARVKSWSIAKIEGMLGETMTEGGIKQKCVKLAKHELAHRHLQ